MKYAVVLTAVVALAAFAGCSALGAYRKVTVILPQESVWDAVGRDGPWYELQWPSHHGERISFHVAKGEKQIDLFLEKGADIPIAALPYGRGPGAGGWAAAYHGDAEVVLHWKYGDLAGFLIDMWEREPRRSQAISVAHWADRWKEELKRIAETHSPGVIRMNRDEFLMGMLTKQFHSTIVEALPAVPVPVDDFFKGRWYYLQNPSYFFDAESSSEHVLYLSFPGSYTFFHEDSVRAVTLFLDMEGSWYIHYEQQETFSRAGVF